MKRILFLISILSIGIITNAQPYSIGFAGTGESTSVSTVKVDNLTAGTTLTINGNDILLLSSVTGINPIEDRRQSGMKIYPNPMTDNSVLQIYPPVAGMAEIAIFDMTGKMAAQTKSHLDNSIQEFNLSGIKNGLYMINVTGRDYHFSGKLLSTSNFGGTISFEKITNNQIVDEKTNTLDIKGINGTVNMQYTTGDRLKFTGISGIYSTVMTNIPSSDKIITFNFIACTDGGNNNYPVVQIGSKTWMAENLRTSKLNDGSEVSQITDDQEWEQNPIAGYCWYENDYTNNGNIYGALYNWFAVQTNKLCPVDWHVSNISEWENMIISLGGSNIAGNKLKEQGTTHWGSPNTGATNEIGFTALPSGERNFNGDFMGLTVLGIWWTSDLNTISGKYYYIDSSNSIVLSGIPFGEYPHDGYSVRCVKD